MTLSFLTLLGVARGLLQERHLQFQPRTVRVRSWQPASNSSSASKLANAQSPPTEPRNPGTPKVHFKVRKMPFWTPRKNGIFRALKCTFGVSGFQGSVGGLGVCNSSQPDIVCALGRRKTARKSPRQDFVHRLAQTLANSWSTPRQLPPHGNLQGPSLQQSSGNTRLFWVIRARFGEGPESPRQARVGLLNKSNSYPEHLKQHSPADNAAANHEAIVPSRLQV